MLFSTLCAGDILRRPPPLYTTVDPKQVGQQRSIPKSIFRDMGDKKEDKADTMTITKGGRRDKVDTMTNKKGDKTGDKTDTVTNKKGDKTGDKKGGKGKQKGEKTDAVTNKKGDKTRDKGRPDTVTNKRETRPETKGDRRCRLRSIVERTCRKGKGTGKRCMNAFEQNQ